jgi:hypothetical protein
VIAGWTSAVRSGPLRRLNCRSGVLRWCLTDLHPSVLCKDALAVLKRPMQYTSGQPGGRGDN